MIDILILNFFQLFLWDISIIFISTFKYHAWNIESNC